MSQCHHTNADVVLYDDLTPHHLLGLRRIWRWRGVQLSAAEWPQEPEMRPISACQQRGRGGLYVVLLGVSR